MKLASEITVLFFVAIIVTIALYYWYGGTAYVKAFFGGYSSLAKALLSFPQSYPSTAGQAAQ